MKKILFPKIVTRIGFWIFTIILAVMLSAFSFDKGALILCIVLLLPIYIFYMNARIRDWNGDRFWWNLFFAGILLMMIVGVGQEDRVQVQSGLPILFIIHLCLLLKKGNSKSKGYETVRLDLNEKLELWKLRRQKRKIERQKEIEYLRNEVEKN